MKKVIYIVFCSLLCFSCHEKRERTDQGHTNACWIYAMCACIEHEAANRGDDVYLSRQWLAVNELKEQTMAIFLERRQASNINRSFPFVGGSWRRVSLRNVGPEVLYLIRHYGLIPERNEKTQINNSNVLERELSLLAGQATSMDELKRGIDEVMPRFTVARHPEEGKENTFYYYSVEYNPFQFAESVMYYQDWRFYAPSPYHPHGKMFALEVPDNRRYHEYVDLSMQEILHEVINSLAHGHYVYWELGRRTKDNIVTSRHAMAIIGINKGGDFICLNSYGRKWGKGGLCTVSQKEFMEHTCNVGIFTSPEGYEMR